MKILENKIPPPVLLVIVLLLMWRIAPLDDLLELPHWFAIGTAIILLLTGLAVAVLANISFRRAQTTVNPLKPETASQLVTSGIFKHTRNPMYLGMVLWACAAAVYFSSVWSLLLVVQLAVYLDRLQIIPEERAMIKLFGEQYIQYKNRVRRWL